MTLAARCYLDFNATAPLRPQARAAMIAALDLTGNASSIHTEGRAARAVIEQARRAVAALCGAPPRGVIFTSGGTEAANAALAPTKPTTRLIIGATEHVCVLSGHRFAPQAVEIAPVHRDGRLDLSALEALIKRSGAGPPMLALQAANNETGVVQSVAAVAELIHAAGGLVICDAVQMAGRAPIDIKAMGADLLFLSAHKLGGPKGAGALIAAREDALPPALLRGGGQERGARAGTENIAAIAGFGAAAEAAKADLAGEAARLSALRDRLWAEIAALAPGAARFGGDAPRLPNTLNFAIPGRDAPTMVMALDLAGVAVSSGSACSSGKVTRSHVLEAMAVAPQLAAGAIRLSLGWSSQPSDVERFGAALAQVLRQGRRGDARLP